MTHNPKLGGGVPLSLSAIYCSLLTVSTSLAYELGVNSLSVLLSPHLSLFGHHITVTVAEEERSVCVCGGGGCGGFQWVHSIFLERCDRKMQV